VKEFGDRERVTMKHIQLETRIDSTFLPELYSAATESSEIRELRVIDWNLAADDRGTLLYAIDGDSVVFDEGASKTEGIDNCSFACTDETISYALVSARPAAMPFLSTFIAVIARAGLVVRKPLVYRDKRSYARVVGEPAPLQEAIDDTPTGIKVEIQQIGQYPSRAENPWMGLSDRQQETIKTALQLGYYKQPREATHAEIAAEMGCAPNTVTIHLQRGEAKIIQSVEKRLRDTARSEPSI
jgi:predicted DNA binding protein